MRNVVVLIRFSLIQNTWAQTPLERPTFEEIVTSFNDGMLLIDVTGTPLPTPVAMYNKCRAPKTQNRE